MLGSMVATTVHGSQCSVRKVQSGLLHWVDRLSDTMKVWIMQQRYGNDDTRIEKLRKPDKQADKEFAAKNFTGGTDRYAREFDPRAFLVCCSLARSYTNFIAKLCTCCNALHLCLLLHCTILTLQQGTSANCSIHSFS
eukprot:jgi/Ulvmu1/3400/UM016_0016.1